MVEPEEQMRHLCEVLVATRAPQVKVHWEMLGCDEPEWTKERVYAGRTACHAEIIGYAIVCPENLLELPQFGFQQRFLPEHQPPVDADTIKDLNIQAWSVCAALIAYTHGVRTVAYEVEERFDPAYLAVDVSYIGLRKLHEVAQEANNRGLLSVDAADLWQRSREILLRATIYEWVATGEPLY